MHNYQELTAEDRHAIKKEQKAGVWEVGMILAGLYGAMPAYFYFFDDMDGKGLLTYYAICTAIVVVLGLLFRGVFKDYRADLREGLKLCGITVVQKKSKVVTKSGTAHFYFDLELNGPREVRVERDMFHRFAEGALIQIELAKHSGKVLKVAPAPENPYRDA